MRLYIAFDSISNSFPIGIDWFEYVFELIFGLFYQTLFSFQVHCNSLLIDFKKMILTSFLVDLIDLYLVLIRFQ